MSLIFYQTNCRLKYAASAYVYPFFHQNWSFFTNPPKSNYRLIIVSNQGIEDVLFNTLSKHQSNRLAGEESNVVSITNLIHYFDNSESKTPGAISEDENFNLLVNYLLNHYRNKKIKRVILETESIETKKKLIYYKDI